MSYFKSFPRVFYKFGDEQTSDVFENLSVYSDMVDQIRDKVSLYEDYYILPGERPDQVSQKLYDTPEYHWTFYLMNQKLREQGWPLSSANLFAFAQKEYNHSVVTTRDIITDKFAIGQTMTGLTSGTTGVITHRNLDLGQIWIEGTSAFTAGETVTSTNSQSQIESITATSWALQYNAAHHYENVNKEYVDLGFESDGTRSAPGAQLTEITWLDRLIAQNENLESIRVIKKTVIGQITESFREAVTL